MWLMGFVLVENCFSLRRLDSSREQAGGLAPFPSGCDFPYVFS